MGYRWEAEGRDLDGGTSALGGVGQGNGRCDGGVVHDETSCSDPIVPLSLV